MYYWMVIASTSIAAIDRNSIELWSNDNEPNIMDRIDIINWSINWKYFVWLFDGSIRFENDFNVSGCSTIGIFHCKCTKPVLRFISNLFV